MPRISSFYGIAIYMYWDEGHHARPHFHARYAGQAASIDLDGKLIAGSLPRRALGLVAEWARLHREELEANWERARREESLGPSRRFPSIGAVDQLFDVTAVDVVGDFRLRLTFEDGTVGEVGFADRVWRGVFEPLRDPAYFARVRVDPDSGTIVWPNGVDMAPEILYEQARRNLVERASSAR